MALLFVEQEVLVLICVMCELSWSVVLSCLADKCMVMLLWNMPFVEYLFVF